MRNTVLFLGLFLALASFYLLLNKNEVKPYEMKKKKETSFLGKKAWTNYTPNDESQLERLNISSVKVAFFVMSAEGEKHYIVSQKKHLKEASEKDKKWEFPGGKIDKDESTLSALMREVKEEDPSQILYKSLSAKQLQYKILRLKDKSLHLLFLSPLYEKDWLKLEELNSKNALENHETYGFSLVSEQKLLETQKDRTLWTPKSLKLLKALRKDKILSP